MGREFLSRVESLRGLAALSVAGFHFATLDIITGTPSSYLAKATGGALWLQFRLYLAAFNGFGGVVAFFVISGFVLARSLDRRIDEGPWLGDFLKSRAFRLLPASIAAICLFALFYHMFGANYYGASFAPANMLLNMIFVETDINRVMWSMKVEIVGIPVIVGSVLAVKLWGVRPVIAFAVVLFGLSFASAYNRLLGDGPNLGPLYAFAIGVLVHFRGNVIARAIPSWAPALLAIFWVLVFCACGSGTTGWTILGESLSTASLIILIVHFPDLVVLRPLDWPITRFYGRISYSFYLLHPLTLWLSTLAVAPLREAYAAGTPLIVLTLGLAVASIILVTPAAYLMWKFVELPGIAMGRKLAASRLSAQQAAPVE